MEMKPNPQCSNVACLGRHVTLEEYMLTKLVRDAAGKAKMDAEALIAVECVVHTENEWNICVVDDSEPDKKDVQTSDYLSSEELWNWFQNRRYALRAKAAKNPGKLNVSSLLRDDSAIAKSVPRVPQPIPAPLVTVRNVPQAPQHLPAPAVKGTGRNVADSTSMEFEVKSARDGAWYDVATFLSLRNLETGDPEVLVRFAGFGAEEDEWVNIRRLVRQRSLPCESSECVAVLPGDLILCFQEGKEQALYFDAHVLDAQRRRHDVRGCRCRFLVRYDHDQSEEIVPLRKVCRRPESDFRLQQLHALDESTTANQHKTSSDPRMANTLRVYPPAEATPKHHKSEEHADVVRVVPAASLTNLPAVTEMKVVPEKSNDPPGSVVQQPKVREIINAETLGNSNVRPGNDGCGE